MGCKTTKHRAMGRKNDEIKRLKADINELLLKHEKEKNMLMVSLEKAGEEIKRLKATLEQLDDHGRAAAAMETIKAQKAEIEKLREKYGKAKDVDGSIVVIP